MYFFVGHLRAEYLELEIGFISLPYATKSLRWEECVVLSSVISVVTP